jgi:hypothetical protein
MTLILSIFPFKNYNGMLDRKRHREACWIRGPRKIGNHRYMPNLAALVSLAMVNLTNNIPHKIRCENRNLYSYNPAKSQVRYSLPSTHLLQTQLSSQESPCTTKPEHEWLFPSMMVSHTA